MSRLKDIAVVVILILVLGWGAKAYYGKKIDSLKTAYRLGKEANEQLIKVQNEKIGEYIYSVGILENNIEEARSITKEQQDVIKALQKDLNAKIDEVAFLSVTIDSLKSEGVAEIVILPDSNQIVYKVNEHKEGYKLDFSLTHPTGDYVYVIKQDPLTMEIYLAKEKGSGVRVGSIRFPNNPGVNVSAWELLYDPETRPWYQRFWEDMRFDVGVFGGNTTGISAMIGYKKVVAGPVFTEEGMNLGFVYSIK